ncbi:MAG TPA: phosphatidylserine decarboxylase [Planctomycetota bacterium]|nr:phosphatidylserine decarboxylase [Planctomycetota bacterium]
MGFPWVARYGLRELVLFGLALGSVACVLATLNPYLALLPIAPYLFILYFFRDPFRRIPDGETLLVSPADGRILEVSDVEETTYLHESCVKVAIFLSVMDVHVNRAPIAGEVARTEYRRGAFKHAASDAAATLNESNDIVIRSDKLETAVLMRQVAGAAARRIVFIPSVGTAVRRGEKVGMIKLGSRTEVFIPRAKVDQVRVKPSDMVKGGESVLAVLKPTVAAA